MLRIAKPLSRALGKVRCRGRMKILSTAGGEGPVQAGVSQRGMRLMDIPRKEVQQHLLLSAFLLLARAEA